MMAIESPYGSQKDIIITKRYSFVMGFDIGTFSTSVSYALVDDEDNIITIIKWPDTNESDFGGRVASACLYETIDDPPRIGGSAHKRFYKSNHLFRTPNIKSYLTDPTYLEQYPLPEGLTPIKLLADYIKQLHKLAVTEMKTYFNSNEAEIEAIAVADSKDDSTRKVDGKSPICKLVEESEIRYIVSYPDNQKDKYKDNMKSAFEMAGIISPSDPKERLIFITESEATAYTCTVEGNIKYSEKPYIVCDIGGTVFGISTLKVFELSDTGAVKAQIGQSSSECGSIKLDKNIRRYLAEVITVSDEKDLDLLERVIERVFDFYVKEIKPRYNDNEEDSYYEMEDISSIAGSSIHSKCFEDNSFVFSYKDMRDKVFGPVINEILTNIQKVVDDCNEGISGIFISGAIGHDDYLIRIIDDKYRKAVTRVASLNKGLFAVSKGLVICGFRDRGRMIPYFEDSFDEPRDKVLDIDGKIATDDEKNINFSGHDYVIGLDFGTTFSGLAYAKASYCNNTNIDHMDVINVVKHWPKWNLKHYAKVPSMLYFDKDMKYHQGSFGLMAKKQSQAVKSDGILVRHFKLMLVRDYDPGLDDEVLRTLDDFQVLDAIVHYLRDFNKEGINRLRRSEEDHGKVPSKLNIGYVITIPAMWSDEAKNTMRVAVKKAGLVKEEHINERVHFITEAEAAAMFCEEFYSDKFSMSTDQRFMICDAGGGTVDLVTFKVFQGEQGQKCISELIAGDGDNCGSIFLDRAFEDYMTERFIENGVRYTEAGMNALLDHFIKEIKPEFDSEVDAYYEDDITIPVPTDCNIDCDAEIPGFIENGEFIIPFIDIEERVFTPVVEKVLELIRNQLLKLNEGEQMLDAILLVGGFGRSGYLLRKIKDEFEDQPVGASFIGSPNEGNLAICKGAVSFGLRPRMVSEGRTRYSYGLQVKKVFSEAQDDPVHKITGYDGNEYCQNVFSTIIAKDTPLKKGQVYVQRVFVTYPHDPVFAIYSTDEEVIPTLTTELEEYIIKVTVKMPELTDVKDGDKVPFDFYFEITGTEVNVEVFHNKKLLRYGVTKTRNIVKTKFTVNKPNKEKPSNAKRGVVSRIKCFFFPNKDT